MILPIVLYGNPVLRVKCQPVTQVTDEIRKLAADMMETMHDARGVGLAAPQVAVPIQMAIIEVPANDESVTVLRVNGVDKTLAETQPIIFLNPKLVLDNTKATGQEGCLSIPHLRYDVRRAGVVTVTYQTLEGETVTMEADGLLGRAFQHEIDHLNGILFTDRLSAASKLGAQRKLKRLVQEWKEEGWTSAQQTRQGDEDEDGE
ncbi:peptide deformylase [Roseimicrobium gellanilyticum]|uniref:Peptide deformylase n=1 Tax=Roseimicrobium gellanilyticum TaxID=748857 RepID=A0A366HCT8_9BACT|nr:peptide deformylase [Roseimicrobium gellanilyticum]RBP39649.1 peptide deformylase [Roseimicrobium gellanilyticum]